MDDFVKKVIKKMVGILGKSPDDKLIDNLLQFVKFGTVGLSNTAVSYAINIVTLFILRPYRLSWDYFAGNMVAFVLSVLWSFYWNNRLVFIQQEGEERNYGKALVKTYIAYGFTGIVLNNLLSWLWISVLGMSKLIAPLINLVISVPINFVLNKLWAFKS